VRASAFGCTGPEQDYHRPRAKLGLVPSGWRVSAAWRILIHPPSHPASPAGHQEISRGVPDPSGSAPSAHPSPIPRSGAGTGPDPAGQSCGPV